MTVRSGGDSQREIVLLDRQVVTTGSGEKNVDRNVEVCTATDERLVTDTYTEGGL